MKVITYTCDMCKESIDKKEIKQFYFDCARIPQQYVVISNNDNRQCEKHICNRCIEVIKSYPND